VAQAGSLAAGCRLLEPDTGGRERTRGIVLGRECRRFCPLRNRRLHLREAGAQDTVGGYEPGANRSTGSE
jgi:hypothetical protein